MCGVVAWRYGSSREAGIGTPVGRYFYTCGYIAFGSIVPLNRVPWLAPIGVAEPTVALATLVEVRMLQQSTCSTVLGGAECASSCARTLGCRAWRLLANECCLGLEALSEQGGDGPSWSSRWSARGEVLHPCERGCLAFGQPSISNVSLDDVPWLRVLQQLETPLVAPEPEPEPEPESSAGSAGSAGAAGAAGAAKTTGIGRSPRVAVCLAGQARSLVEPAVWHLTLNLTLTLFLALTLTLTLTLTLPLPLPLP